MSDHPWVNGFPGVITVCDPEGIILEMNEASQSHFKAQGGGDLIGTNVLDCHPEPSRSLLKEMLETQRPLAKVDEKRGKKRVVYQSPWYRDGKYAGFVEMILELPD